MRKLYFLVPGTGKQYACGGLFAELKTLELARRICPAEVVTYDQREAGTLYLDDLLKDKTHQDGIFVISWGFHISKLVRRLKSCQVVYHAHSSGYGFKLPGNIPIITVSRNSMGYWGQTCPNGLLFYLPNVLSPEFSDRGLPRDIDVLVQVRKSSEYLLDRLVPALQPHCNVVLLEHFVEDLGELFNRSKIYLYDSAEYWAQRQVTEGFGLPPMEAMACGCQVFSSVNGALADYFDPGFNGYKIGAYSTTYDVQRILQALQTDFPLRLTETDLKPYREEAIIPRFAAILAEINHFFDYQASLQPDVPGLSKPRMARLWIKRVKKKLQEKLGQ
jgi:glycosyltransferase involved in cell wall biosynthesis